MENNAKTFRDSSLSDGVLCESLGINAKDAWNVGRSREQIKKLSDTEISALTRKFTHRPFDDKYIFFHKSLVWSMAEPVNQNLAHPGNIALVTSRQLATPPWTHVFCSNGIVEMFLMSNKTKEGNHVFPLYLRAEKDAIEGDSTSQLKNTNISRIYLTRFTDSIAGEGKTGLAPTPEKVFRYIYALLHSNTYRDRYSEFLKIDFPRIPNPSSHGVFDSLAALGEQMIAWHLLEHPSVAAITLTSAAGPSWFGSQRDLTKVAEKGKVLAEEVNSTGKVFVNSTSGFSGVKAGVWQHTIGSYQVLHKWLDDRRKAGRSLSDDDITHWLRVYAALEATQGLMQQVDAAIEAHGGWPGAFSQNHPPPDAATLAAEQQAQKERLKAQKKAAKASSKKAMPASPTGATSLFDDLADLASAAGADEPKP